ncbi:MAG: hypothetical protein RSE57_00795 [Clostridia bacterium]
MKKIISYILVLFLCLTIIGSTLLSIFNKNVLKYNSMIARIEKEDFYNKTYSKINSKFSEYIEQSGLDKDVLKEVCSVEQIKKDVEGTIKSIYYNKEYTIDSDTIKENLTKNIYASLEKEKRIISSAQKSSIDKFVTTITDVYKSEVFPTQIRATLTTYMSKISTLVAIAIPILFGLLGVIAVVLLLINIKGKSSVLTYYGISGISSGILLVIPEVFIKSKLGINNINIISGAISDLLRAIANDIFSSILIYGIVFIVIGIIFVIIGNIIKVNQNRSE